MADAALWVARAALVAGGLGLWFWTQRLIGARPFPSRGIGDAVHDWTAPWNRWLNAHPRAAHPLLIASSAIIDLLGPVLLRAAIFGASVAAWWAAGAAEGFGPVVDRALAALVSAL